MIPSTEVTRSIPSGRLESCGRTGTGAAAAVDAIHKTRVDKTTPARNRAKGLEERETFLGDLMASILDFIGVALMLD